MKICTKCHIEKSLEGFYKNSSSPDGYQSRCKSCHSAYSKSYYKQNTERYAENRLRYDLENADRRKEERAAWEANNKERRLEQKARWREANPGARNAEAALRRARIAKATPPWLNNDMKKQMQDIYLQAALLTKQTGIQHDVDHIMPIAGKESCGLHVPWNLRVITHIENMRKGNRDVQTLLQSP